MDFSNNDFRCYYILYNIDCNIPRLLSYAQCRQLLFISYYQYIET